MIFHLISVVILLDQLCLVPLHDLFKQVIISIVLEFVFPDNNSRWNILFLAVLNSMAGNTKRAQREVSKNASRIRSKFRLQNTRISMASATFQRPHSPKYCKSHVPNNDVYNYKGVSNNFSNQISSQISPSPPRSSC